MSFEAMMWANEAAPVADVNEFAVLNVLGSFADSDGCNAYPSRATIASRAQIDVKTVQRTLDKLEGRRLIALGDQSAAEGIRADRRPPVYDILIPYSWLSRLDHFQRVRKARVSKGRPPLTAQSRPDIAPPPAKEKRSDAGKSRPRRVDSQSPRETTSEGTVSPDGGTSSPARVDYQSATGGLEDHQTCSLNLPVNSLSSSASVVAPEPAAQNDERETIHQGTEPILAAYVTAIGRPVSPTTRTKLQQQAADLLAAGFPAWWLADRARELAAKGWTDLAQHCDRSTIPTIRKSADSKADWCGTCQDPNYRMRKDPAQDNELVECDDCHPAAVARRRRRDQGAAA